MKRVEEYYCESRPTDREIKEGILKLQKREIDKIYETYIIRLVWDCKKVDLLPMDQRENNISGTIRMQIEFGAESEVKNVIKKINDEYDRHRRLFNAIYS